VILGLDAAASTVVDQVAACAMLCGWGRSLQQRLGVPAKPETWALYPRADLFRG